jgi:tRNA-dihydrouridine synthase B
MQIGSVKLDHPLALAPMEDVSDGPFRAICKEFGADLMYTEFANCEALIRNAKKTLNKIVVSDAERPIGVQLYGSVEESLEQATGVAERVEPDFIDINCGCWVKKIAMRGDGAGLLRDLSKFEVVVKSVVSATRLPVTVKTRLGWDKDSIVILDVARMLEQNGVQALAVHCRTRQQGYSGQADWSWLERVKNATAMPLIGNGDVKAAEDAEALFNLGCDGVMIGRGAISNPWIFRQIKHYLATHEHLPEPAPAECIDVCLRHLKAAVAYKGEQRGTTSFRKYYSGYLKGLPWIAKLRAELMDYVEVARIEDRLRRFLEEYEAGLVTAT